MSDDATREALAAYAHEAWAGWMEYLFRHGTQNEDGTFTINAPQVERWRRQMCTLYAELTEGEKDSDRQEADKMIGLVVDLEHERDQAMLVVACAVALVSRAEGLSAQMGGLVSDYITEAEVRALSLALAPYRGDDAPPPLAVCATTAGCRWCRRISLMRCA